MPEGPEIRQAADALARVLVNQEIEAVTLRHEALTNVEEHMVGYRVNEIDCHGKALLTKLSSGYTVYSHNQLYGIWRVVPRGQVPETNRALRLGLHTGKHSALLYSATDISWWRSAEVREHPFLKKLGPDVLARGTNESVVVQQLRIFNKRQLAHIYLDQAFIAGLGNYLRAEILFFGGVHPACKPSQLTDRQLLSLAKATLAVSRRSYKSKGCTLPPRLMPRTRKRHGRVYEADCFAVFARASKACRVCRTKIQKDTMSGRRIYWCPSCQPEPEKR